MVYGKVLSDVLLIGEQQLVPVAGLRIDWTPPLVSPLSGTDTELQKLFFSVLPQSTCCRLVLLMLSPVSPPY